MPDLTVAPAAPTELHGHGWRLLVGDACLALARLPAASIHAICTSPPYYGLRAYGTPPIVIGGSAACRHHWLPVRPPGARTSDTHPGPIQHAGNTGRENRASAVCGFCGAWRGEFGNEGLHDCLAWARGEPPCSQCFVCHLRRVARECWRVLRPDGSWLLNLGDSYYSDAGKGGSGTPTGRNGRGEGYDRTGRPPLPGLKPKDLIGIPWRVALALQADGWTLREDIIFAKQNGMPESVTDRCARAHEYIFHLTKRGDYYWDRVAIAEPSAEPERRRSDTVGGANGHLVRHSVGAEFTGSRTRTARSVWTFPIQPNPEAHFAAFSPALPERVILATTSRRGACPDCGAPWERVTEDVPASGDRQQARRARQLAAAAGLTPAHLAAIRIVGPGADGGHATMVQTGTGRNRPTVQRLATEARRVLGSYYREFMSGEEVTVGWRPTCAHYAARYRAPAYAPLPRRARKRRQRAAWRGRWERVRARPGGADWPTVPCTVLDPYAGTGTTLAVAVALGCEAVGVELNPTYATMIQNRMATGARVLRRAKRPPPAQMDLFSGPPEPAEEDGDE